MGDKNSNYLVVFVLVVMLAVTGVSLLKQGTNQELDSDSQNLSEIKWETLGSEKFYLMLRPVYNDYQIGLVESVEVLFVNEYSYDVKISQPDKAEYWFEPEGKYAGGEINWELTESNLIVPANCTYELYQIDKVGVSNCVLYFETLGQTVSLDLGIEG
jgi:hypothetical protein